VEAGTAVTKILAANRGTKVDIHAETVVGLPLALLCLLLAGGRLHKIVKLMFVEHHVHDKFSLCLF
jgi:hypothetical protein